MRCDKLINLKVFLKCKIKTTNYKLPLHINNSTLIKLKPSKDKLFNHKLIKILTLIATQ